MVLLIYSRWWFFTLWEKTQNPQRKSFTANNLYYIHMQGTEQKTSSRLEDKEKPPENRTYWWRTVSDHGLKVPAKDSGAPCTGAAAHSLGTTTSTPPCLVMSPGGPGWNKSRCLCSALEGPRGASSSIPKFSIYTQYLAWRLEVFLRPWMHNGYPRPLWPPREGSKTDLCPMELGGNTAVDLEGSTVGAIEWIVTFVAL